MESAQVWYVQSSSGGVHRLTLDELDRAFRAGRVSARSMVVPGNSRSVDAPRQSRGNRRGYETGRSSERAPGELRSHGAAPARDASRPRLADCGLRTGVDHWSGHGAWPPEPRVHASSRSACDRFGGGGEAMGLGLARGSGEPGQETRVYGAAGLRSARLARLTRAAGHPGDLRGRPLDADSIPKAGSTGRSGARDCRHRSPGGRARGSRRRRSRTASRHRTTDRPKIASPSGHVEELRARLTGRPIGIHDGRQQVRSAQ